ncbi:techylectin-5A-like [Oratosquilla oratoria]|uniref:techylectin-5A-like n=1 Tax=Oratosquilla oratoria TaxID=337810 RepID=UPI003F75BA71
MSHSLQELRIDVSDFDNATRWAKYGFFHVRDSDSKYVMNCGSFKGAWWYTKCHSSNLIGKYLRGTTESYADGVTWSSWRGQHYSLCNVEMKIRPSESLKP